MSDDKVRAEFEAWMHTFDFPPDLEGEVFLDERYIDSPLYGKFYYFETGTQRCWAAWQASRAALVAVLPPLPQEAEARAMHYACRRAVERAGVRVKI